MARRYAALGNFHVFAVEDTALQFAWRGFPPGLLTIEVGGNVVELEQSGEPGALTVSGLSADTEYRCVARVSTSSDVRTATTRTLPSAPGQELCRIGTVNDLHIGSETFGILHGMKERPRPETLSGLRCAQAALDEIGGWGIRHLFIKGDAINRNLPGEWEDLRELISNRPFSVDLGFGNHERLNDYIAHAGVQKAELAPVTPVRWADLPGVRVIMAETALPRTGRGAVSPITDEVADLASSAATPVLVFLHQHLETTRIPYMLPLGVPVEEANQFLNALGASNPNVIAASGHTHRHRRRDIHHGRGGGGMITVVEVGSTKDYPGTWTGYAVHEGGIRQVVRRVERPDCIEWTEHTRRAVFGAWGRWSPGSLADRCWIRTWG